QVASSTTMPGLPRLAASHSVETKPEEVMTVPSWLKPALAQRRMMPRQIRNRDHHRGIVDLMPVQPFEGSGDRNDMRLDVLMLVGQPVDAAGLGTVGLADEQMADL